MIFSEKLRDRGQKKYHYNKHVHGADEEEHKRRHTAWNEGELYSNAENRLKIMNDCNEKRMFNEKIHMKPFRPADYLDRTGKMFGVKLYSLTERRHQVY